jgi:hypothetical protein
MGHTIGVSDSYYKPTERELLVDYLKAESLLSITKKDTERIEQELKDLKDRNENSEYLINSKLQERDDAIKSLSDQVMILMNELQKLKK